MIKRILSISGKPGLYRLVSQGKNMLIVEALGTGKRMPVYSHDKVISLGDITMYTLDGDMPLAEVLQALYAKQQGKSIDLKAFANDGEMRALFAETIPNFDDERIYNTDIRKLFSWYNQLIAAGITEFVEKKEEPAPEVATGTDQEVKK